MGIGNTKQVQIVPFTSTKNSTGSWVETRGIEVNVWAEVLQPSGFRQYLNGQTQLGQTKDFVIRYRFDKILGADWRIIYDKQVWTVSEMLRIDEKKFYYRLTATAKSNV